MANSRISDLNKITVLAPGFDLTNDPLEERQQGSGMFLIANKKLGNEHIEYRDLKTTITSDMVFASGGTQDILGDKTFLGNITFAGNVTDGPDGANANLDSVTADFAAFSVISGSDSLTLEGDELFFSGDYVTISGDNKFNLSDFKTGELNTTQALNLSSNKVDIAAGAEININSPVVSISEDVFIKGDLFVSGETVTFDVGTLAVEDKTIELAASTTGVDGAPVPTTDTTADGAGLIVSSDAGGDKTWIWEYNALSSELASAWTSNQSISITGDGNHLVIRNPLPPTSPEDNAGELGEVTWDDNFVYVKTNNGWRRSVLASW